MALWPITKHSFPRHITKNKPKKKPHTAGFTAIVCGFAFGD
jgi:hypothetical protein